MKIKQVIENLFYVKYDLKNNTYKTYFKNSEIEYNLGIQLTIKEKLNNILKKYPDTFEKLKNNICVNIEDENDKIYISKLYEKKSYIYCAAFIKSIAKHNEISKFNEIDTLTGFLQYSSIINKKLKHKKYIMLIEIKNYNELILSNYKDLDDLISAFAEFINAFFIDNLLYVARVKEKQFLLVFNEIDNNELKKLINRFLKFIMKMNIRVSLGIVKDIDIKEAYKKCLAVIEWNKENNQNLSFYNDIYLKFYKSSYETRMLIIDSIRNNNFEFYFQPYYSIKQNKIIGAESLLRIYDKKGNIIPPSKFIDLAEKSGLIQEIEEIVIDKLFSSQKQLNNLTLSYNLSANSFSKDIVKNIFLDKLHKNITIEITERMILDNKKAKEAIEYIKKFGAKISIDDFGTGYSSLLNLLEYEIDYIKIDMSFVKTLITNKNSYFIVKNIINLANELNIKVISEGVETKEQFRELKKLGCDIIQGYLISKPLPFDEFKKFIKEFKIEY